MDYFRFFILIFKLQFTFSIILYQFWVCTIVVLQPNALHSAPKYFQYSPGTVHSSHNNIDHIPYAVLYVPMTIL